jgi:protein NrfC
MDRENGETTTITRRDFMKVTGAIIMVAGASGCRRFAAEESPTPADTPAPTGAPAPTNSVAPTDMPEAILVTPQEIPPADGYLLVDIKKCQGCASCMLACSLIHEGVQSLSLSRIQVVQDSFETFPEDLTIEQCRQCVDPPCVKVCPTGALHADASHGNVRVVNEEECIGCGLCYDACPYTPSRAFLVPDSAYGDAPKSRKCDLCANAPYHWDDAGGGPDGKQACVAVCPVGAIVFTKEIPEQDGDGGYRVNLRDEAWASLGYPTS